MSFTEEEFLAKHLWRVFVEHFWVELAIPTKTWIW